MILFEICRIGNNKGTSESRQKQFRKRSNEKQIIKINEIA